MTQPFSGTILKGIYRLEHQIGVGGFSQVFAAQQQGMARRVAVKILLPDVTSIDQQAVQRFELEGSNLQRLASPHTVRVHDVGRTAHDVPFMVMELLQGRSLLNVMRSGPLPHERVRQIAIQALKALGEAHEQDIVHRDVTPGNIMLCSYYEEPEFVKIIDFGIAKLIDDHRIALTQQGKVMGTPRFMAPEQLKGQPVGPHTDLYALGLVMAEALCGQEIYASGRPVHLIVQQQISTDPPPIPEAVLQGPLGAVVRRATLKTPGDRYPSARAMLRDLRALDSLGAYTVGASGIGWEGAANHQDGTEQLSLPANLGEHTPGDVVCGYRLEQLLLEKSSTLLFRASQPGLERTVVLKLLKPELRSNAQLLGRFERELSLIGKLQHPNLVVAIDGGLPPRADTPFLAFEDLQGATLLQALTQPEPRPMGSDRVAEIATQVLAALGQAHKLGVVHRNLKPSNIVLCETPGSRDAVKVIDLGLARLFDEGQANPVTREGQPVGSPRYMAPEQFTSQGLGPHTDLYALGLIMAEALSGQAMVNPHQPITSIIQAQCSPDPLPLPDAVQQSPLAAVVRKATAKGLDERYISAAQMLHDIEALTAARRASSARPTRRPQSRGVAPWGMVGCDARRSGQAASPGPTRTPRVRWALTAESPLLSPPTVGRDGTLYISLPHGQLRAITPSGDWGWQLDLPMELLTSPAIGLDGTLYIGTGDGQLVAVESWGELRWARPIGHAIRAPLLINARDHILAVSTDGVMAEFLNDGTNVWTGRTPGGVDLGGVASTPSGSLRLGARDRHVRAVKPGGDLLWQFKTRGDLHASVALGRDGACYATTTDGHLYALDASGVEMWRARIGVRPVAPPSVDRDGVVFVASDQGTLLALSGGQPRWSVQLDSPVYTRPVLDLDGNVFVSCVNGKLAAFSPGGHLAWHLRFDQPLITPPVLGADQTLYVGCDDGSLYALTTAP